jgi:predicted transcriptional regulator
MDANITVALIGGGCSLLGVMISNSLSNRRVENQLEKANAVMETKFEMYQKSTAEKFDALTEEVKKHNNFASRMPVVEEQIKVINHRLADLEEK